MGLGDSMGSGGCGVHGDVLRGNPMRCGGSTNRTERPEVPLAPVTQWAQAGRRQTQRKQVRRSPNLVVHTSRLVTALSVRSL